MVACSPAAAPADDLMISPSLTLSQSATWGTRPAKQSPGPVKQSLVTPVLVGEDVSILDGVPMVGACLVAGTVAAFVALNMAVLTSLPGSKPGALEQQACAVAITMQMSTLLHELFVKQRLVAHQLWLERAILTVKVLSTMTNFVIYFYPTPFNVDPMTGAQNCMMRWAEWTVLAFTMTYIVESIDSSDLRTTFLSAGSQSLSTFCGLLLPLCPRKLWWPVW